MLKDYEALLTEIQEITTVDGFVSSCLEIKESMFFYERDLMLAAYSASLELLIVVALLSATLKGEEELLEAGAELEHLLSKLMFELNNYQFPLDIQYVVDHFSQGAGLHSRLRMPVYREMMHIYAFSPENEEDELDNLLQKAHRFVEESTPAQARELNTIFGQIGVRMLSGARLRSIWLKICHPRILVVIQGLQTLVNNFRVTPYFNYPLESVRIERQKRKRVKGNTVSDLGVFRNFRQGGPGYTDLTAVVDQDEYDLFFESLLIGFEHLDVEPDQQVVDLILLMFEISLVNKDMDREFLLRLVVYCKHWAISEVNDLVLQILNGLDSGDPLYYECWSLLKSLDSKALPAIRRYVRAYPDSSLIPYLAFFVSHGPPAKRRWNLLVEMFDRYPEESEEKAQIAMSISQYGGEQAVTFLEQALGSTARSDYAYQEKLKRALESAKQANS